MRPESWLTVAGLGTWIVSSLVTLAEIARGEMAWAQAGPWLLAFVAFGAAFSLIGLARRKKRASR